MAAALRTTALAVTLGLAGWLLFLTVASGTRAGGGPAVDPAGLYPADGRFAAAVLVRGLVLCAAVAVVAWLLTRRGERSGRWLCGVLAALLVAVWAMRAGGAAGGIGVATDLRALAAATAPHTAAELGMIVLPLVAGARGHAPRARWLAVCAAGLALCAAAEAFL